METLYHVTGDYQRLLEQDVETEEDSSAFLALLDEIQDRLAVKAEGCAKAIKICERQAEACRAEAKRLTEAARHLESKAGRILEYVEYNMSLTSLKDLQAGVFRFKVALNPPSLDVYDLSQIPAGYDLEAERKIDTTRIKADLKSGKEVPGARLMQKERLALK
jgi:hypothetical protein